MDARAFCALAGFLATRSDPASCRSAVSRAYYSLFHVIHEFMDSNGIPLPKKRAECHEQVYRLLFNSGDADLAIIASSLNDLRGRRNEADYDLKRSDIEDRKTAMLLVETAKRATENFDQYCRDSAKINQAILAVTRYAELVRLR